MHHPTEGPHPYSARGGLARYFVEHREVGWMALLAVLVWGWIAYRSLPQQEDPTLPRRIARVVALYPGASADRVEQLVTRPLERKISELETILEMSSETRDSYVVVTLGQRPDSPSRVEQEWDKLRAKLAELTLPDGAGPALLQTDFGDITTMLLGVTGTGEKTYGELEAAARRLEEELRQIPSVARTRQLGAVGEVIDLEFVPSELLRRGVPLTRLYEVVKQQGHLLPGGLLHSGAEQRPVQVRAEISSEADLRNMLIGVDAVGAPVRVSDVCAIRRGAPQPLPLHTDVFARDPSGELTRQRSVIVAVEMLAGEVVGEFGRQVRERIARARGSLGDGIEVLTISDQPLTVDHRLGHFARCFGEAVLVVILVALLLMDWRAALIVAAAIPITIALTLGGMQLLGIPLHQISIAALIIALGMLVDDPVVAADGINRELAAGEPRERAAWFGPFRLRRAILFATLINIFAFLPLVLLPGDKKSFIASLPIVVTMSLIASRVVSMTFIPLLGYYLLRGQRGFELGGDVRRWVPFSFVDRALLGLVPLYRVLLRDALRRPVAALLLAYALLGASALIAPRIGRQFFPPAERAQFLIDVALPESASIAATGEACDQIVQTLRHETGILSGAIFIGGSGPRFYYNVTPRAPANHLAQFILNAADPSMVPDLVSRLRVRLDAEIRGVRCVVKRLEQGPPMETPIQLRLTGEDFFTLRATADQVATALKKAGAYHVHDDLGIPTTALDVQVNAEKAGVLQVSSQGTALLLRTALAEVNVAEMHEGDRLIPIRLRVRRSEVHSVEKLGELVIETTNGAGVPVRAVAEVEEVPRFTVLPHFGSRRSITVKAYAPTGEMAEMVLGRARMEVDAIALPAGIALEYAGEARELEQSRSEMGGVMAISLALIALSMVIQFNSVTKSLAVMVTVPLGLIGALLGLWSFEAPLGFMAMLGVVSLAGVIVSHIIVLSDFIEEARAEGMELREALQRAGLVRMRPVLVTVLATAAGLVPLALTGGELWRPLTAVHIVGLLVATVLTLFVLPVVYFIFAQRLRWIR